MTPYDALLQQTKKKITDTAQRLFAPVQKFVTDNPTPIGFAQKTFQPQIQQELRNSPMVSVAKRVINTPVMPFVPQSTPKNIGETVSKNLLYDPETKRIAPSGGIWTMKELGDVSADYAKGKISKQEFINRSSDLSLPLVMNVSSGIDKISLRTKMKPGSYTNVREIDNPAIAGKIKSKKQSLEQIRENLIQSNQNPTSYPLPPNTNPKRITQKVQMRPKSSKSVGKTSASIISQNAEIDPFVAEMDALAAKPYPKIKPKTPIDKISGSDAEQLAAKAQLNAEGNQTTFQKIFSQFIGERESAKTKGVLVGAQIRSLPASGEDIIKAIENPSSASPNIQQYIADFRKLDDEVFLEAKKQGMDINYLKNHIAHFWDQSEQQVKEMYTVFKQKYGLSNSRVIPSYDEGIKMGLKPKFTNPAQILAESVRKLEEVKAGMRAFTELKDRGFIVPSSVGLRQQGFAPITAPGFPRSVGRVNDELGMMGNWFAPKEIADQINKVFSPADYGTIGAITGKTRALSGILQDVGLSGGLPGTPINAFGIAQVQKETLAGRPIQAVSSFIRSISDKATRNFFEQNANQIIKMQERNIPVSSSFSVANLAGTNIKQEIQGVFSNILKRDLGEAGNGIGTVWNSMVNHPTFQRFMPQLQISLFNDIEKAALKQGKSTQEAADIAAKAVQNFYGTTRSDVKAMGKGLQDPLVQNFLGTFTFAPKFRESMVNFWVNNAKVLKNPFALENRANITFIMGAVATYIGMDRLNYMFNGKHMSENPPGTEDKLLIPTEDGDVIGIPFLSSIATIPRAVYRQGKLLAKGDVQGMAKDVAQSYSSMLIKPIADVISNADYFGKKIYTDDSTAGEKFLAQGKYLATSFFGHPYLKELLDPRNQGDPIFQRLSRAMEAPLRFYTNASLNSKEYYAARDKAIKGLSEKEQSALNAIPAYDKEDPNDPNTRIMKYQIYLTYPKVFEAKQQTELEMAAKTGKAIDPLYLVDYETAKKYMRYEALPEGSQDRKAMTQAYPELVAMFDIRGKYFDQNPMTGLGVSKRPVASADVQAAMDAKNWTYPGVREYLDANTQWNNSQREKLGLPPIAGYSSYAKKGLKPTLKKTSFKKIKALKVAKAKKIKMPKLVKIKLLKPKKSKQVKTAKLNLKPLQVKNS